MLEKLKKINNKLTYLLNEYLLSVHDKTILKQNKNLILSYFSNGLRRGHNLLTLLLKYKETLDPKQRDETYIISILDKIKNIIDEKGTNTPSILHEVGLLTEKEYLIISNYNELYIGLDLVLKMNKQKNNFNLAILLLFFPPFIVLVGLFLFQPELRDFAYETIEPINAQSKTRITIPPYLEDRWFFGIFIIIYLSVYLSIMQGIEYIKQKYPHLYFKLFRLAEKEFIVNTFSSIMNLRKSGKSFSQSYLMLSTTTKDTFIKKYYTDVYNETVGGNIHGIYKISKEFNMENFNLSYFKVGVLNNDLDNTIETILEYNTEKYDKQVALLVKILPLVGEVIMTIILLKPLIDIIMVTTVDVMNFTL
jgi:hypothetical protein